MSTIYNNSEQQEDSVDSRRCANGRKRARMNKRDDVVLVINLVVSSLKAIY